MRTSKRRILSMVLALMLCFSVLPVTAFAGGGPEDGSDKVLEYWSQDSTPPQDTQQTDQQTGQPATGQQSQQGEPLSVDSEFLPAICFTAKTLISSLSPWRVGTGIFFTF